MFKFRIAAFSASLLVATCFGAQASSVEAEWVSTPSVAMDVAVIEAARPNDVAAVPDEHAQTDAVLSQQAVLSDEDVAAALAPEKFVDARDDETFALITADLAAIAEATGSIAPARAGIEPVEPFSAAESGRMDGETEN